MTRLKPTKAYPKAPDGGYGWMIVLSSFMIHFLADGITYTFGIFYVELLKHFKAGKGITAWVPSIMTGITYGIGPIASGLTNKYGCRTITIVGALFASFGLVTSVIAPNVTYLFFSIGICAGAGFGLIYLPAIVSVTCYFEKRRAFATGIAVCGSGIGSAAFAPLTEWLIRLYGWRGGLLIIASLLLNCCVFGALLRPLEETESDEDEDQVNADNNNNVDSCKKIIEEPINDSKVTPRNVILAKKITAEKPENNARDIGTIMINTSFSNIDGPVVGSVSSLALGNNIQNDQTRLPMLTISEPLSPSRHSICALYPPMTGQLQPSGELAEKHENLNIGNNLMNGLTIANGNTNNYLMQQNLKIGNDKNQFNSTQQENQVANMESCNTTCRRKHSVTSSCGILYRRDIFYSASLMHLNLPTNHNPNNKLSYSASTSAVNDLSTSSIGSDANPDTRASIEKSMFKFSCMSDWLAFLCSAEVRDTLDEMMNFRLLRNPIFLVFSISNLLTSLGFYVPHIYIKDRVVGLQLASDSEASNLLAIMGIASTIGRLIFGFISDLQVINRLLLFNCCISLCGLTTILSSFVQTYTYMALYCAIFGITCGAYVSLTSVILVDLLGIEKLTNAFGLVLLFQGVACLIGPPIVGWMFDLTGSYDPGFSWAGSMILIGGLILFLLPYLAHGRFKLTLHNNKRKTPKVVVNDSLVVA
uniref:Major facilitator superfamily (MFS) profile domain-containing protein n=1 Tax=Tetranychus urticae TaxID=32264 RepID=T1JX20_TETUR